MRVSVIVIHFRQPVQLARTLAALRRQTAAPDEIVVVDDGSPAPPRVPDGVRLIVQADRGNRAGAARNAGARVAAGDVLVFLDADTAPEPDYLGRLTARPAADADAVVVGRRRYATYDGDVVVRELPPPAWLEEGYRVTRALADADDRTYRYVISAVLACSAALFGRTGGFEETFSEYGGDDWEWAHRAWLAGARFAYVPDAVAWHDGPDWSARSATERQQTKNAEALRLADAVSVAGSRPHAITASRPDVVVEVRGARTEGVAFVCADSVLAALPEAAVVAPGLRRRFPAEARLLAAPVPARVTVTLLGPVRVRGDGLRDLVRGLRPGDAVLVPDVLEARTSRARGAARPATVAGLEPIAGEPDVEGYLGGWLP